MGLEDTDENSLATHRVAANNNISSNGDASNVAPSVLNTDKSTLVHITKKLGVVDSKNDNHHSLVDTIKLLDTSSKDIFYLNVVTRKFLHLTVKWRGKCYKFVC